MSNKWDSVKRSFERAHDDLFSSSAYTATFYNYSDGSYDPSTGGMTSQSRSNIGTIQVELVPPSMDTTVDVEGTSFSWDTSIRFPYTVGSLTVKDGETYTVESGTTDEFEDVTVNDGGTLDVDGNLIVYGQLSVAQNGTVNTSGSLSVLGQSDLPQAIDPLGVDADRPTEVEISDPGESSATVYELHGYSIEQGSGMLMCRLVEQ